METEKKFKIVLGEQPKKVISELIKKGDKKTLKEFAEACKKIKTDPFGVGIPIISEYNKDTLNKLGKLKDKRVNQLGIFNRSLFRTGIDIDLKFNDQLIELYGVSVFYNGCQITIDDLGKKIKEGIVVDSWGYGNEGYEIELSKEKSCDWFIIKAQAILIENKDKKLK